MSKPSHREKILSEGLRVVHAHGFAGASVRDIVQAAGVPNGSFTNHFASKEAFGLEILEIYYASNREIAAATLLNDTLAPLARLRAYIDATKERHLKHGMRNGCLFGNFTAESSDHSEAIRLRLAQIFGQVQQPIATCLRAAVRGGEISPETDCDEIAAFIVAGIQGAHIVGKATRSPVPLERFKEILFSSILKRTGDFRPDSDAAADALNG